MPTIRPEKPADIPAIRDLNDLAFGQPTESKIVDSIRDNCNDTVSLVEVDVDQIVGHIFFSPVTVEHENGTLTGMGLGPMAVLPERQRSGIGSKLVIAGIETIRAQNYPFIILLGHHEYYPRFGFVPASRHGLTCQWQNIPDEVFMALVLDEIRTTNIRGVVFYRDEFDQAI